MRAQDTRQAAMFSYVMLEERVSADHPLRRILSWIDDAPIGLNSRFDALCAPTGRESIPPERLLRALRVQELFSIRGERQLMEQLTYNLRFRWFVGLGVDDAEWDVTVFTKNRERRGEPATYESRVAAMASTVNRTRSSIAKRRS